jgi:hypothetical protein
MKIDVVFSFDTTGSMYPCLAEVRRRLSESVGRLFDELDDLRIGLVAHGDYCDDRPGSYVTKGTPLTSDFHQLERWIKNVGRTGGGDAPECYEAVLYIGNQSTNWRDDATKVFVLIGDDVPHPVGYRYMGYRNELDWREEARGMVGQGVAIYAVQCLNRHGRGWFYEELGKMNGYKIALNAFDNITETVLALAYKQLGDDQVIAYRNEVEEVGRLNRGLQELFNTLLGETAEYAYREGLVPVRPGRFQTFRIDDKTKIKLFVVGMGIEFKVGRGFYELTKPVLVQEKKEVVLRDQTTGDMFTGETARNSIGLPFGERGRVKPSDASMDGFDVFIQSTSWNRWLLPGTEFLYEVPEDG